MKKQQKKEAGFIVSAELVLIATIVVIGMIVGLAIIRDAVTAEMNDVAEAIGSVDQSYNWAGITSLNSAGATLAIIAGSEWEDTEDGLAGDDVDPIYVSPAGDSEEGSVF
jgi:hypothetical protein